MPVLLHSDTHVQYIRIDIKFVAVLSATISFYWILEIVIASNTVCMAHVKSSTSVCLYCYECLSFCILRIGHRAIKYISLGYPSFYPKLYFYVNFPSGELCVGMDTPIKWFHHYDKIIFLFSIPESTLKRTLVFSTTFLKFKVFQIDLIVFIYIFTNRVPAVLVSWNSTNVYIYQPSLPTSLS